MAVTPQQPNQPHQASGQAAQRIPLEQIDVRSLSKDKIREMFRQGKLPTADQIVEEILTSCCSKRMRMISISSRLKEKCRFG